MRKLVSLTICMILLMNMYIPCSAALNDQIIHYTQTGLGNGIVCTEIITVSPNQSRASTRTATNSRIFTRDGETIAEISITGTFNYNGSTVSVISKSISKCETYDGWSFKQSSFTSSGGTITLEGKLTKLIVLNADISISLSCDKNGNIS